jgi:hypothetical protein
LLFVAAILIVFRAATALVKVPLAPARLAAAYLIGTTAMLWLVARLDSFIV